MGKKKHRDRDRDEKEDVEEVERSSDKGNSAKEKVFIFKDAIQNLFPLRYV